MISRGNYRIAFSFESGLVSSDLAVRVGPEVMMQAEDDN